MLRDPAFGRREPLGPLVDHPQTAAVDLASAKRDLPFVPLRGGPFGHQCREANDFLATSGREDVVVLLPGARLGPVVTAARSMVAGAIPVVPVIWVVVWRHVGVTGPVGSHRASPPSQSTECC